jgi:hypothetical protein
MNNVEAAKILALCAVAYPQYPLTKETVSVYAELLADLSSEQVEKAVKELLMTSDRWLSIASIRRKVAEQSGSLAPSKIEAWGEVMVQMRVTGTYGHPVFTHDAISQTVQHLGWRSLCMSDNVETSRSQFWRAYEELVNRFDRVALVGNQLEMSSPSRKTLTV